MSNAGLSYKMGYNKAVEQGYYIANTELMGTLWGVTSKKNNLTGSFSESLGNVGKIENRGQYFLREIINKQNYAIQLWFQYLSKVGIVKPSTINGATMKQYYDIVHSLGGIQSISSGVTKNSAEDILVNNIIKAKSRFNIPIMIRDAILAKVNNGLIEVRSNGTLKISTLIIESVINEVYDKMANDILNNSTLLENSQIDNIKNRIVAALKTNIPLEGTLREIIKKNKNKLKISKDNRIIRGRGKGLTGLLLENSKLQDFNVAEYAAAAIGAGLGAKARATGSDLTRVIKILDNSTQTITSQLVSGKDDAVWDFLDALPQLKQADIRVHISTKLYGVRSSKGGLANSSGLSTINLEGAGKATYRYQELEKLLSNNMDQKTYKQIVFGINNLAKDSLLEGSAFVKKYENILAIFFAAFMFDSSMDELTNNFSEGNDTYNIYLFNLNGQFYTLAEICERLLTLTYKSPDTFASYIKTTIKPAPSHVADPKSGAMLIGGSIENPPFSVGQWNSVKQEIENATLFSTTTLNAKKLLELAGLPV